MTTKLGKALKLGEATELNKDVRLGNTTGLKKVRAQQGCRA